MFSYCRFHHQYKLGLSSSSLLSIGELLISTININLTFPMLNSARSGRSAPKSGSKHSKETSLTRTKSKLQSLSSTQLKLREAINIKFIRSNINKYAYNPQEDDSCSKTRSGVPKKGSQSSREMQDYLHLLAVKVVRLREYHEGEPQNKSHTKYHIRMRYSQNKKTLQTPRSIATDNSSLYRSFEKTATKTNNWPRRILAKSKDFPHKNDHLRETHSGEKDERGKQWTRRLGNHAHSPPQSSTTLPRQPQQQLKSKLYLLKKHQRSPPKDSL